MHNRGYNVIQRYRRIAFISIVLGRALVLKRVVGAGVNVREMREDYLKHLLLRLADLHVNDLHYSTSN